MTGDDRPGPYIEFPQPEPGETLKIKGLVLPRNIAEQGALMAGKGVYPSDGVRELRDALAMIVRDGLTSENLTRARLAVDWYDNVLEIEQVPGH